MKTNFKVDMSKYVSQGAEDVDLNIRIKSKKMEEITAAVMSRNELNKFVILDSGYKDGHRSFQDVKEYPAKILPSKTREKNQLFELLKGTELKESYTEISTIKISAKINIDILKKFNTDKKNVFPVSAIRDLLQFATIELYQKKPTSKVMFRAVISSITIENLENNDVVFSFSAQGVESSLFNKAIQLPDLSTELKTLPQRRQIFKSKMEKYLSFSNGFDINLYDIPLYSKNDTLWELLHQFAIFNNTFMTINYNSSSRFGFDVGFSTKRTTKVIEPHTETDSSNFISQTISNKIANPTVTESKDLMFNKVTENLASFKRKSKVILEVKNGDVLVPYSNVYYFRGLNGVIVDWNQSDKNNLTGFTTTTIDNGYINAEVGWYTSGVELNNVSILDGKTKIVQNQQFDMHLAEKSIEIDANYMDIIQNLKEQKQKSDMLDLTFKEFVFNGSYDFNVGESYFIKMKTKRKDENPIAINVEPLAVVGRTIKFDSNSLSEGITLTISLSSNFAEKWIEIFKASKKLSKWGTLKFDFNIKGDWIYRNSGALPSNVKPGLNGAINSLKNGLNPTSWAKMQPLWNTYKHTRPVIDGQWDNGERAKYDHIEQFDDYTWVGVRSAKNDNEKLILDYYNTQEDNANFSARYEINPDDFVQSNEDDMRGFYANGLTENNMQSFGLVLNSDGFAITKIFSEFIIGATNPSNGHFSSSKYGYYSVDKASSMKGINPDGDKLADFEFNDKKEELQEATNDYLNTSKLKVNNLPIGIITNDQMDNIEEYYNTNVREANKYSSVPVIFHYSKKWPTLEEFKQHEENHNGEKWWTDTSHYTWSVKILDDKKNRFWRNTPIWRTLTKEVPRVIDVKDLKWMKQGVFFDISRPYYIPLIGQDDKFVYIPPFLKGYSGIEIFKKKFKNHEFLQKLKSSYYHNLISTMPDATYQQSKALELDRYSKILSNWILPGEGLGNATNGIPEVNNLGYVAQGIQILGMHNFVSHNNGKASNFALMRRTNNKYSKGDNRVSCLITNYRGGYVQDNLLDNNQSDLYALTIAESQLFDEMKVGNLETVSFKDWAVYVYQNDLTNIVKFGKEKYDDYPLDPFGFTGVMTPLSTQNWQEEDLINLKVNFADYDISSYLNDTQFGGISTVEYKAKRINVNKIDGNINKIKSFDTKKYTHDHGTAIKFDFNVIMYDDIELMKYYFAIETARFLKPSYLMNKLVDKAAYDLNDFEFWWNKTESDEKYNLIFKCGDISFLNKGMLGSFWKWGLSAMSRYYSFINDNMALYTNPDKTNVPTVMSVYPNAVQAGGLIDMTFEKFVKITGSGGKLYGIMDLTKEGGEFGHFTLCDNSILKDFISYNFGSNFMEKHAIDLSQCNTVKLTYDYKNGSKSSTNAIAYLNGRQSLSDFSISIKCGAIPIDRFIPGGDITIKKIAFIYYGTEWEITLPNSMSYDFDDLVDFSFTFSMTPIHSHAVPTLNWFTAMNTVFGHEINGGVNIAPMGYKNGNKKVGEYSWHNIDLNYNHSNEILKVDQDFSKVNLDGLRDSNIHGNILQGISVRIYAPGVYASRVNEAPYIPHKKDNVLDSEVIGKDVWSKKGPKTIQLVSTIYVDE